MSDCISRTQRLGLPDVNCNYINCIRIFTIVLFSRALT